MQLIAKQHVHKMIARVLLGRTLFESLFVLASSVACSSNKVTPHPPESESHMFGHVLPRQPTSSFKSGSRGKVQVLSGTGERSTTTLNLYKFPSQKTAFRKDNLANSRGMCEGRIFEWAWRRLGMEAFVFSVTCPDKGWERAYQS